MSQKPLSSSLLEFLDLVAGEDEPTNLESENDVSSTEEGMNMMLA